jgi:hypothetical protein
MAVWAMIFVLIFLCHPCTPRHSLAPTARAGVRQVQLSQTLAVGRYVCYLRIEQYIRVIT